MMSKGGDEDEAALRMEINDLQNSLKEEKWYTAELKKELNSTVTSRSNLQNGNTLNLL